MYRCYNEDIYGMKFQFTCDEMDGYVTGKH